MRKWTTIALMMAGMTLLSGAPSRAASQTPVSRACPQSNEILIGIRGRQGQWMDQVAGACALISDVVARQAIVKDWTSTAGTGTGGTFHQFLCPGGQVVVGLTGTKDAAPFITPDVVTTVHHLHCQELDKDTHKGIGTKNPLTAFSNIGDAGSYTMGPGYCLDGKVGMALQTTSATYVHNVALSCNWALGADQTIAAGTPVPPPPPPGSSTSPSTNRPDLVPVVTGTAFRHIAQIRKVASEPFCNGMFPQPTTAVVKTITVPAISFAVKNQGTADVPATSVFVVSVIVNGQTIPIPVTGGLRVGEARTIYTYSRAQSQTEVARMPQVPSATQRQIYNALGGECVQTIGQESQYDWQDPTFEVRVDSGSAVTESNESNNSKNN